MICEAYGPFIFGAHDGGRVDVPEFNRICERLGFETRLDLPTPKPTIDPEQDTPEL
jgi:hypothetical protein